MAELTTFDALFDEALASARQRGEPDWHLQQRKAAFARFAAQGLPSMRDESWKYTNVKPMSEGLFALPDESFAAEAQDVPVPREDEFQIVFINGVLSHARSQFGAHEGVTLKPLFDAMSNGDSLQLQPLIERPPMAASGVFGALHSAFLSNGVLVRIDPKANVKKRIHILCLQTRVSPGVLSAPRVVVQAGASSQASIVQSHVGVLDAAGFTNTAIDIQLEPNAELAFCKIQSEGGGLYHFSHLYAVQQRDSRLNLFDFSIGGRLVRNN
ncbi:MAG: SufD family Fe-S cluster assembly protein, partial [Verrucomicrobia bacterium]|nr:SufD family Fe-S cluster assembly protein [Verrucomicrobiota bacterium]